MNIIVDYGLGNLSSVSKAFERIGISTKISWNREEIAAASALILPGVGAFRDAIGRLKELDLIPSIKKHAEDGKHLLGICLGMQLLFEKSYENGEYDGLGLIEGCIKRLEGDLKVPHMGWNSLEFASNDRILKYIKENDYVYYVHSYYAQCGKDNVVAYSDYGIKVPSIVKKNNIYGMQFHPEKSAAVGENLLRAFGELIS